MGFGDDIMATADAARAYREKPVKVAIGDGERFYWSEVFDNNPILATPAEIRKRAPFQWIVNCPGHRPYINYDAMEKPIKAAPRFVWNDVGPLTPGTIAFTAKERPQLLGGRYVVIEPHIKPKASPNKDWGFSRYEALVRAMPGVRFVQPNTGLPVLRGAESVRTHVFRDVCRLLRDAVAYVGPEGGLHHAAAAVGTPAVVIFGGYISPRQTGYNMHRNLFTGGEPCGMRAPCGHCEEAMAAISPFDVAEQLNLIMEMT